MNKMNGKTVLRVDLGAEQSEMFDAIKKNIGVKSNTEVVRSLINRRYREIYPITNSEPVVEVEA